jgi:NADH dehydrogenase (ubiquinone) 1 beta subcomplex subunit 7
MEAVGRTGSCRSNEPERRTSSHKPRLQQMSSTTASQEELKTHRVPLAWRDQCSAYVLFLCAHLEPSLNLRSVHVTFPSFQNRLVVLNFLYSLLLPLNVCRKDKYYLPWECENERHTYEKCVSSSFVVHLAHKTIIASRQVSIRRVRFLILLYSAIH